MAVPPKIKKVWKSTDPWRGYYTYEVAPEDADRTRIIDLVYIARDPKENEEYLETAKELLKKRGFHVRKAILPSSNVFGMNVALIVYKDKPLTEKEKDFLNEFEEAYIDYYTTSFSIFTGETYNLDTDGFRNAVEEIAKKKLGEVV